MAYINAQEVSQIRKELKNKFPKFKFSVRKTSGSHAVAVSVMAGPTDFSDITDHSGHVNVNHYHMYHYGHHEPFFDEVVKTIKSASDNKWFDESDPMTDYFHVAFYFDVSVGRWDKPYEMKG